MVELVLAALSDEPRRSVLLVGAHGTGKSALARAALERLPTTTVFEASATEIMAGASFIGELEARVRRLAEAMRTRDVVWALPDLQATLYAGQHSRSPQGLLDAILPNVESGAMTLVAEITPTALEALQTARPRLTSAFDVVRLRALENDEALAVARHELEHDELEVTADDATLARAYDLAQQFLSGVAAPGNLVRLVRATVTDAAERGVSRFDAGDVLSTLASASGLPLRLLDADAPLHLEDVRSFFEERILEQPDAIDCVVDRIAMIKAGLTDPTRPLGVFLLLGPTGTGKTEIAKALAEFLFGSAERLVRLDMSEFKTPEALERLLAPTTEVAGTAGLVASVRSNPFSVVLLDEFEKAAEPVWDVFLQVFDDGRLTDAHGNLVDFRRTVIVLTSNVGSAIAARPGAGFAPTEPGFSPANAERALQATFRPEFLNRLDRVVFFRAFERSAMRSLLDKELASALARRGLRERPWAIEVDESAYAFLVENGFSPTLGARPLRRAIERHLLAPLAAAIVEQRVPAGDQFLFVSAPAGAIEVTFVDPDADAVDTGDEPSETVDLLSLARNGRADARSARHVLAEAARIEGEVDALGSVKAGALAALAEPSFWETPGRFATLAKAEYLDRLEAATQTSRRLATRVERSLTTDGSTGGSLVQLLAGRLVVLDAAVRGLEVDDPYELFLEIIPSVEARADGFHERLEEMYRGWGRRRGMTVEALHTTPGSRLFHVSGLGCWRLLHEEAGLHVLEQPKERGSDRETVRVSIAPRRPGPFEDGPVVEARRALERVAPPTVVVRRYRDGAASLVRDAVRGYRTGHLDRVLEGEFDLF